MPVKHHTTRDNCECTRNPFLWIGASLARCVILTLCLLYTGCGTTKWSDTGRTGTEQLLISDAIDHAVGKIDFSPMQQRRVFVRTDALDGITDSKYLALALRQQLAVSGGILCEYIEDADYIVEVRAGAIGTDRDDTLLFGVPAFNLPLIPGSTTSTTAIPEIPVIKRTRQKGVAKIAVFAFNRHTGLPVWASGNNQCESNANNLWFAGSGPLAKGTIYEDPLFADYKIPKFLQWKKQKPSPANEAIVLNEPADAPTLKKKRSMIATTYPADQKSTPTTYSTPPEVSQPAPNNAEAGEAGPVR